MKREIEQLRKELARTIHQREIVKNFGHHFGSVEARYQMIRELSREEAARPLCELLGWRAAATVYRGQLQRCGVLASMSHKANCYDNAAMEASCTSLKRQALEQSGLWSKERVRRGIFEYKCQRAVKTSQGWADENQPL